MSNRELSYRRAIIRYRVNLDIERTRLQRELDREDLGPSERTELKHTQVGIDYAIEKLTDEFPLLIVERNLPTHTPDTTLDSIDMPTKVRTLLYGLRESYTLETLGDLAQIESMQLRSHVGFGQWTLDQVRLLLKSAGLDYKDAKSYEMGRSF